jgi:hypothetical protein
MKVRQLSMRGLATAMAMAMATLPAHGADDGAKARRRAGAMVQLEVAAGGDDLRGSALENPSNADMGQGVMLAVGGFYRPVADSAWELQVLAGHKAAILVPIRVGPDSNVSRWTLQVLGQYRAENKFYWGGGLVYHINPKYYDDWPDAQDVDFDDAPGAMVEAGWNWVGVQCTYMEYRANRGLGTFDASHCGLRFTWRFRKWGPLE